jgi:hypothetical protein
MGVGMDGKVKYHDVYTQPGEGNRQLIKGASALGSVALGVGSFAKAVEGAEITMTYRDEAGVLRESIVRQADTGKQLQSAALGVGSAVMGQLFNKYGSRFNAMRQNKDFSYIYAKDPSGEKVLVKVRKADGVEVDKLIFKNDRPIYEVDPATQTVYYVLDNAVQVFYNKK